MRLIVACCEVTYSGRLNAFLPESTRLLMVKEDGAVLVHANADRLADAHQRVQFSPTTTSS